MLGGMAAPVDEGGWRLDRRVVAVIVVVGVIGGVLWSFFRSGEPFARGTRSFSGNGITLSYPAGWIVNDLGWPSSGFGSTFAIIGTQPWGACLPVDINCHYRLRLEPSQISVALSSGQTPGPSICELGIDRSDLAGRGPNDPPAEGHLMRVDGRPTVQTDYAVNQTDYYHSDAWRTWLIAAPGSTASTYRIEAMYRGPGDDVFRQQLDALIATVEFSSAAQQANGGPGDCGAPFS